MKISFSLPDVVAKQLEISASRLSNGNASLLVDLALRRLFEMPEAELQKLVDRRKLDRMTASRGGWMKAFWLSLGDAMGRTDMIENPYGPRNYGDFYVVLLLNHLDRPDEEGDPFLSCVGPRVAPSPLSGPHNWAFGRSASPVSAAEVVAAALRKLGVVEDANES